MEISSNVSLILDILRDEVRGDVNAAVKKMSSNYKMTWMYKKGDTLFPFSKPDFESEMKEVYPIKGRKYEIKNIAEGKDVVMLELVESYPDPETGEVYRTPMVLVSKFEGGKISGGRHYCDPAVSWLNLKAEQVESAYEDTPTRFVIE